METTQPTRVTWLAAVCLALAACAAPAPGPEAAAQTPPKPVVGEAPALPFVPIPRTVAESSAPPGPVLTNTIACGGPVTQGGALLCKTDPGSPLSLNGKPVAIADTEGIAVIGLTRVQASPAIIGFADPADQSAPNDRRSFKLLVEVKPRTDTVSTLTMECNKIAPQSVEEKRKAEVSWVKKDNALKIFSEPLAPVLLLQPVAGTLSSSFGATRTYVPKTKDCEPTTNVHNGTDIAVQTGTEIRAPMAGTVILADLDLYFEGGCIFLDLGRGLVSVTMHMSRIDVKPGDKVKQGDLLGLSGATGRVTGPHVHWAIKYRNVLSSDRGADIWLDPVLMMSLQPTKVAPQ